MKTPFPLVNIQPSRVLRGSVDGVIASRAIEAGIARRECEKVQCIN